MSSSDATAGFGVAAFLGALQGLTEFLPVSSSGHLVLFQQFFALGDDILFDLVLHIGTLIPVLWWYRDTVLEVVRDIFMGSGPFLSRPGVRMSALVLTATVPTGLIGVAFKDILEAMFANPVALPFQFATTGLILWSTTRCEPGKDTLSEMTFKQALIIGIVQGVAIMPGISRAGSTIAAGLWLGLDRSYAARFSFLISIPAICGAVVLKARDIESLTMTVPELLVGAGTALVVGYFALSWIVKMVQAGNFARFAWYCWFIACVALVVALTRG
jgi:undecaprenyl-diphosphatase